MSLKKIVDVMRTRGDTFLPFFLMTYFSDCTRSTRLWPYYIGIMIWICQSLVIMDFLVVTIIRLFQIDVFANPATHVSMTTKLLAFRHSFLRLVKYVHPVSITQVLIKKSCPVSIMIKCLLQ